ncbi:MAG: DUF2442 domain-containing protein [Thermoanaerobaculia bacterium]|nr:DUF2442 domain-containing protein [Thermoanaerobaculia bacterium]
MKRVRKVEARSGHKLYVEFEDGACGVVDLSDRLFGPMFEPLADPELFQQVTIDEFGAVSWPNGADLAPDALRRALAIEA